MCIEQIFEGRQELGIFSGRLKFVQRRPQIHPEPVVKPDTPADGAGCSIYGTVIREGGLFRMWYCAIPSSWDRRGDVASYAYAESEDGINWRKPSLGLVESDSGPNNLIDLGLHSATFFIDPQSSPEHRYRATGCIIPGHHFLGNKDALQGGYHTAHSADGLHWLLDSPYPRWLGSDVINSAWHQGRGGAVISLKRTPLLRHLRRRSIDTASWQDGNYSDALPALYPDEYDDIVAAQRGYHSTDYYGMGMMPAGRESIIGFLWNYRHSLPYSGASAAVYGSSDISLVYQPQPGAKWFHFPGRAPLIDCSEIPWASGWINSASTTMDIGDETRLYFSGRPWDHGFGLNANWQREDRWADYMRKYSGGGITFASWPRGRLTGYEGDPEGSFDIELWRSGRMPDRPFEVLLNYEVLRPEGFVKVSLMDMEKAREGYEESLPLEGNSLEETVRWNSGSVVKPGKRLALRVSLSLARVYAWQVREV